MTTADDNFYQEGLRILRSLKTPNVSASIKASPWKLKLPDFPVNEVNNGGFRSANNVAAMPEAFTMPSFNNESARSPDNQFVSILSSPSIPTCNPRGSGLPVGKLVWSKIIDTLDDGTWTYTGSFSTDAVEFGTTEPIA